MADVRLIDANAILKKTRRMYAPDEIDSIDPIATACVTVDDIHRAPTIDAVPAAHAKWEKRYKMIVCAGTDGCFEALPWHFYTKKMFGGKLPAYCPNCGEKMDGGAEG